MTEDQIWEMVRNAGHKLNEHVEAVQILITWTEADETHTIKFGVGNWHARQGMAHDFINCGIADEQATRIAREIKKEEE